jgi:hypothetical protein
LEPSFSATITPTITPTTPPTIFSPCPSSDYVFNNKTLSCYKFVAIALDWYSARDSCAADGAYLATIDSEIEQEEIVNNIDSNNDKWIGLYQTKNPPVDNNGVVNFIWVNNSTTSSYSDWGVGEPSGDDASGKNCAYMWPTLNNKWNDQPCVNFKFYLCEISITPSNEPTATPTDESTLSH